MVFRLECGAEPVHINGHLVTTEEDAESENEDAVNEKLLSQSGKWSSSGGDNKESSTEKYQNLMKMMRMMKMILMMRNLKKKLQWRNPYKTPQSENAQKSTQNGKDLKTSTISSKGQESFKNKQEKLLEH